MSCPICQKDTDPKVRPFCSKRCADIDLGRWMGESYAIPSEDPEDMAEAAEAFEQWLNDPSSQDTKH